MEPIKELRHILQEEKINPVGWKRPWGYKTFQRGPSIYITRFLLSTSVTPTQVTTTGILLGLSGCLFLLHGEWYWKLCGLFLLYLSVLADKVDGELARYKKIFSLKGIFWDEISHLIVPPLMWLALARGLVNISIYDERLFLVTTSLGAVALVINRIIHSLPAQIYAKKYLKYKELFGTIQGPQATTYDTPPENKIKKIVSVLRPLHYFQDFFIIIAAPTGIILFERIFLRDYIFHVPLASFMLLASILFILFAIENIIKKSRAVEKEIAEIASLSHKS